METVEERLDRLEREVERLRDHVAISQLIASYGPLADTAENFELGLDAGSLWEEDGRYDLGSDWIGTGPQGVAALLDNGEHQALVGQGGAHVLSLPVITLSGDEAKAVNYSRVYRHEAGHFSLWRVSANYWELRRTDGQWKVVLRRNRMLDGSEDARAILRQVATFRG